MAGMASWHGILTEVASMKAYSNSWFRLRSCRCRKSALATSRKRETWTECVAGTCSSWIVSSVIVYVVMVMVVVLMQTGEAMFQKGSLNLGVFLLRLL